MFFIHNDFFIHLFIFERKLIAPLNHSTVFYKRKKMAIYYKCDSTVTCLNHKVLMHILYNINILYIYLYIYIYFI